ncbi:MAG: CHAD domain-containing protein [FCB group bacterium]|nr:CHAD domain-containing protein [FCB group bacterium]
MSITVTEHREEGLAFWMRAVLDERAKVLENATADAVHDLRVAVRRCRSMAEGMMAVDKPGPWRKMRRQAREVFRELGVLRDTHVMLEWVQQLGEPEDPVRLAIEALLGAREAEAKAAALVALKDFRVKRWKNWAGDLSARVDRLEAGNPVFAHLALERWREARALFIAAERSGLPEGYHRLRVGIKRFRYTVENFLPESYAEWEKRLKELQDLLGDVHDLDVLEVLLPQAGEVYDAEAQVRWTARIEHEKTRRMSAFRRRTTGAKSVWDAWRKGLPSRGELAEAAMAKLEAWASFRDDDFPATRESARRALEAFDAVKSGTTLLAQGPPSVRRVFQAACLLRRAGEDKDAEALPLLLGWTLRQKAMVACIVRTAARGPQAKPLAPFTQAERETVVALSGLLRIGEAHTYRGTAEEKDVLPPSPPGRGLG